MIARHMNSRRPLIALATAIAILAGATAAHAATFEGPVKQILNTRIGWEVNKKTKENSCLIASEECRPGRQSSQPGGFEFAKGIAVDGDKASSRYGDLYVIDNTHRVQELDAAGAFVSMFGRDVNETTGGDICSEEEVKTEGVKCKPGMAGGAPGQLGESQPGIAVDPVDGSVYVSDLVKGELPGKTTNGMRVQKFTATGEWVWEIGKEVNETKTAKFKEPGNPQGITEAEENLCTHQEEVGEGVKCGPPAQYEFGGEPPANSSEPGVFPLGAETRMAVGGAEDLVYVGAGERVQEFTAGGGYKGQISLTGAVKAMALDDSCQLHEPVLSGPACASFDLAYGDVYVLYAGTTAIHKFKSSGEEVKDEHWPLTLSARLTNVEFFFVAALAIDPSGHLAVSETEIFKDNSRHPFGSLRDSSTGGEISAFGIPGTAPLNALAFSAGDELYGTVEHEALGYIPKAIAEVLLLSHECTTGPEHETSATLDCTLKGEIDPWGVSETEAWFRWGRSAALGEETEHQQIKNATEPPVEGKEEPLVPVSAVIEGVRPNERFFYYRLAANDRNVKLPEELDSPEPLGKFATPIVAPWVGELSASFFTSSSAILSAHLNPENAKTEYLFEYAPGSGLADCPNGLSAERAHCEAEGVRATAKQEAPCPELEPGTHTCEYGKIGATIEATGLQPSTEYRYRLFAESEDAEGAEHASDLEKGGPPPAEGSFTTRPNAVPQAATGAATAVGATSATIAGSVDPDGQPATYAFELGVDDGAATQYVAVSSGSAGEGTTFVTRELQLTGLQPGTTYAYRIKIASGYGSALGATDTFTTAGLPSALAVPSVLAQLPVPLIPFPTEPAKVTPKKLTRAQQLARALKACARKPKRKRAACRRAAHRKYRVGKKARTGAVHGKGALPSR
jgi:hypothetical protein